MCKVSELIIMVADSEEESRLRMCDALQEIGLQQLLCAVDAVHGAYLSAELVGDKKTLSMLFLNSNFRGMPSGDFIQKVSVVHTGIIPITYSKDISPEAHIMAMWENGSVDHIEQTTQFETRVSVVAKRWLRQAQLQFDYRKKYDTSKLAGIPV